LTTSAIILILVSAFMHAGWNLLGKHSVPDLAFFFLANLFGSLILLFPISIYNSDLLIFFDWHTLWYGCISGLFLGAYYWGLALGYRMGDLSIIYPLARSFPVILVSLFMIQAGYKGIINLSFVSGGLLIVCGSIILPMRHFKDFTRSHYLNRSTWYAFIAAFGTAGYSIVDARAINGLKILIDQPQQIIAVTLIYAFVQVLFASFWMGMVLLYNQQTRQSVVNMWHKKLKAFLFTGTGIHATYALVLISMSMVENVSYVVAFRQVSIPIGVIFGIYFFKESKSLPKILGVIAMFTGVTLVSIG
jgi:drug/metabolite transporter (DMT)-like permease